MWLQHWQTPLLRLLSNAPLGEHQCTSNCDQKSTNSSRCESGSPGALLPPPLLFRPLSFTFLPPSPTPHTQGSHASSREWVWTTCMMIWMGMSPQSQNCIFSPSLSPPPTLLPCFTVSIQLRVKRAGTPEMAAGSTFAQPGRPLLSRRNPAVLYGGAASIASRRGALFFCWVFSEREHK